MKYFFSFWILIGLYASGLYGQSIRKNYQEMTASERTALVNAFYVLRSDSPNGPADLISDLAIFHSDFFNFDNSSDPTQLDIHFNLPDEPERQIFFAWHRMQMFELEQAMQNITPTLSIPYWDSSVDQSVNSPLWDNDFMGQFNVTWSLNRNLGGNGPLPTPGDVINVQSIGEFLVYANQMERGPVHRGAHVWTGGAMPTTLSPRDPIFYLHHTFVDKLWNDWETNNPGGSSHIITSMIRYDGTYVFDGTTLPLVDPDDIVNSRVLGVFYAENQLAELSDYEVSNTYKPVENFYYQYLIRAGNDFLIPIGTNCQIQSVTRIQLTPGFTAQTGSSFVARIDFEQDMGISAKDIMASAENVEKMAFEFNEAILDKNAYDPEPPDNERNKIRIHPNPFIEYINVTLDRQLINTTATLYDLNGRALYTKNFTNAITLEINGISNLASGAYILKLVSDGKTIVREIVIKQ